MFYNDDEDDIELYDDEDEYEGDDEDDEDDEDEEETLKELDVDENGHVVEGRRKRRRAGAYDEDFEDNPEAYGFY